MDSSIVILPQKVLSNQICSECCNYLSIGPVMVHEGKKICGLCTARDYKKKASLSLYNKIAVNCTFKCINHYSGCNGVFMYNKIIDHEKTCKQANLKCPYCEFIGNGCQLVYHFKKKHPKYTAEDNVFRILLEPGSYDFIFVENDDLLCVSLHITDQSINISNLLPARDNNSYLQYFKLIFFNSNFSIQYVTPEVQTNTNRKLYNQRENAVMLEKGPIMSRFPSGKCLFKVNVMRGNENILKQVNHLQKSVTAEILQKSITGESYLKNRDLLFDQILTMNTAELKKFVCTALSNLQLCVNCGEYNLGQSNIYLCLNHHSACESCSYRKCQKCNVFSQLSKLNIPYSLSLECDWEGCDEHVYICDFLFHKQRCPHRRYQCPGPNCRYNGRLEDFKKHWHLTPYMEPYREPYTRDEFGSVKFYGNSAYYCFLPLCREFVHVIIEWDDKMITVNVNEEQVVLRHAYDINVSYYPNNSVYISFPNQKLEYSQSGVARTLISPIPINSDEKYLSLSFVKKF